MMHHNPAWLVIIVHLVSAEMKATFKCRKAVSCFHSHIEKKRQKNPAICLFLMLSFWIINHQMGWLMLNKAEKHHSQIERKALIIIWCIGKFHLFLYSQTFTLVTTNKPLTTLLWTKQCLPWVSEESTLLYL